MVQDGQTLPRQIGCGTFGRGGRLLKTMLPISVSDVARDPDLLHATHMPLPRTCGIKLHIERHGRHPTAFIQRRERNQGCCQHRELLTRAVGGGGPLPGSVGHGTAGLEQQAWRRNVHTDAPASIGQRLEGEAIVDLGRGGIVNGVDLWARLWKGGQ